MFRYLYKRYRMWRLDRILRPTLECNLTREEYLKIVKEVYGDE